jgi:hypothetical protein
MNVEFADKQWFHATMTREQAEQRLRRASNGTYLVRPSSQPSCYALSLKNQDAEIVHVVVGTSFSEQQRQTTPQSASRSRLAFWVNIGGVPTAFDSMEAVATELGVVPMELHGTLASSLSRSFVGTADDISSASAAPAAASKVTVHYQKLPRASLMMKLAEEEGDYGELKSTTPTASASATATAAELTEMYATRELPRVASSSSLSSSDGLTRKSVARVASTSSDDDAELPPLPPVVETVKRDSTNISVLLPDAEQPVTVRVSRGSTAASLVAPALAKRLPLSTLAAAAYSFVALPTPQQPGFIVNANVPLEALLELIGHNDADDDDERRSVLEMWELPDVLNVRLASHDGETRATVIDFGVPLDRMLRVLRLRFGDKLAPTEDILLRFNDKWLRLAVSLEAQGIARATSYNGVLTIHRVSDALRAIGSWRSPQSATFFIGGAGNDAQQVRLYDDQRLLVLGNKSDAPDAYALEFLVVVLHGDSELVLSRRGASRDAVLRLRSNDVTLVSTWFELLRRASLQSARRVFNVPLDELLRREGRRAVVPQLVHAAVAFLRNLDPMPPALFQRPGSPQLLGLLRSQADGGAPLVLDSLDPADAHAVASLLLEFLCELPEPPVTFALVGPLCLCAERLVRDIANRADAEARFVELLGKLPPENADLLRFVCDFCNEMCSRQRVSVEKLGFVFCRALVRRPPENSSAAADRERKASAVYYRAAEQASAVADLAPPEEKADQQQLALATKLIQLSNRIPGPRGVARNVVTKQRSRGRARSDALSHVAKASNASMNFF